MADNKPEVAVIMGSASDWETMKHACEMLDQFELPYMKQVISAHRTPELMGEFAHNARANGLKVIIAGAGGAAHLPGMVAVRLGFAAVHRADAGRHSGGHHRRRQLRRNQRRPARGEHSEHHRRATGQGAAGLS